MAEARACIIVIKHGDDIQGTFHRWADSYYHDESNNRVPLTVAIVEGADGRVYTAEPDEIRFTGSRSAQAALRSKADKLWDEVEGNQPV